MDIVDIPDGDIATASYQVTVNDVAPVVSLDVATQTIQYSDEIGTVTVTVTVDGADTHTIAVTVTDDDALAATVTTELVVIQEDGSSIPRTPTRSPSASTPLGGDSPAFALRADIREVGRGNRWWWFEPATVPEVVAGSAASPRGR